MHNIKITRDLNKTYELWLALKRSGTLVEPNSIRWDERGKMAYYISPEDTRHYMDGYDLVSESCCAVEGTMEL